MKKIKNRLTVLALFTCLPLFAYAKGEDSAPKKISTLEALPNETLFTVVKYLKTEPLIELIRVNQRFGSIIQAPSMLGPLEDWPVVPDGILGTTVDERVR